jgi:hypothetical protein
MKTLFISFLCMQATLLFAQNDSTKKWTFSGYGEMYYSYDFSKPPKHEKADFIYNHKRHNEINANLITAKANYTDRLIRANLGLMAGNYAQYNLNAEPTWAQFIYEANIGIKLSKKHNLWLDAGIMPSHIGFESAVSADCWTLTRSLLAENSPYYETGLKIGFTNKKENLHLAFLVLNGWQKIQKPNHIQNPSFGLQVNYKLKENLVFNYGNFLGTDQADSIKAFRTFHNLYLQYAPEKKIGVIAGFDIGTDKYNMTDYGIWFSPVIILRYALTSKMKIALRGEYYFDKKQIIITTNTLNGFQVSGLSANIDYAINRRIEFRMEGKMYHSTDRIFEGSTNNNFSLTTNMTIKL